MAAQPCVTRRLTGSTRMVASPSRSRTPTHTAPSPTASGPASGPPSGLPTSTLPVTWWPSGPHAAGRRPATAPIPPPRRPRRWPARRAAAHARPPATRTRRRCHPSTPPCSRVAPDGRPSPCRRPTAARATSATATAAVTTHQDRLGVSTAASHASRVRVHCPPILRYQTPSEPAPERRSKGGTGDRSGRRPPASKAAARALEVWEATEPNLSFEQHPGTCAPHPE